MMAYLPNFYFGGLTAWIGQDILKDWLFIAAKRISAVEYALLLATFGLVMAAGLEEGIAAGIVLAALHFAYRYVVCLHASWLRSAYICNSNSLPSMLLVSAAIHGSR